MTSRGSRRFYRTLFLALGAAASIWRFAAGPLPDAASAAQAGGDQITEAVGAVCAGSGLADVAPAYEGEPSVALSPTSGLAAEDAPASVVLPELDSLGRPGSVEITVSADTLPAEGEERGSIGMVKPTGWHTVRDDSIDGRYPYNRCHLIAWCLSGLNAEARNLITGTRYMNVEGMLPYETQVAQHVRSTGGRVYYKVAPDFRGEDLVARGVRIQALSLDDDGVGVDLDVYCHNVQPGYEIDYATGEPSAL